MKLIYLGAPFFGPHNRAQDPNSFLSRTGGNSGNLLIGAAILRQLAPVRLTVSSVSAQTAKREYDHIVIGAANWLHQGNDLASLANYLERCNLPITIIGLGAQASRDTDALVLPNGTRRLLQIAAERCKLIGVRGLHTAELLNNIGVKNVHVTGCPSLYFSLNPTVKISARPAYAEAVIGFNGSRDVIVHSHSPGKLRFIENAIMMEAFRRKAVYILQSEGIELKLLYKQELSAEETLELQSTYWTMKEIWPEFTNYLKSGLGGFIDYESWVNVIREHHFIMGTRFHGNLIGLINRIPAVILTHDTRTTEMCEFAAIPHHHIQGLTDLNFERIYNEADYTSFECRYQLLFKNYRLFLEQNGLAHKLSAEAEAVSVTENDT